MTVLPVITTRTLDNGLTWTHAEYPGLKRSAMELYLGYGHNAAKMLAVNDKIITPHFFEHMVIARSALLPDAKHDIMRVCSQNGGNIQATTSPRTTHFALTAHYSELDYNASLLVEALVRPVFTFDDIATETDVIANEKNRAVTSDLWPWRGIYSKTMNEEWLHSLDDWSKYMYPEHPVALSVTPDDLYEMHEKMFTDGARIITFGKEADFSSHLKELQQIRLTPHTHIALQQPFF